MSSLFEVPAQLVMILSFVASGAADPSRLDGIVPEQATSTMIERPLGFSDQTWLEAVMIGSGGEVLAPYAARIFKTSSGRFYVPSDSDRQNIKSLKGNSVLVAAVALGFARRNAFVMQAALERAPTAGELYLAHAVGSETAVALIQATARVPNEALSARFPEVTAAYPELARDRGRQQTVGAAVRRTVNAVDQNPLAETVAAVLDTADDDDAATIVSRSNPGRFALAPKQDGATRGWDAAVIEAR